MSVHNGEKYLRLAIDSILNQTFGDFEFIIVNDGSTDRSMEILNSYSDSRIRLICNESNIGLTDALNEGVKVARGTYIARMDCDDISLPERLARQVVFMDSFPQVGVCGTWARDIDCAGKIIADRQRRTGKSLEYYYWIPSPVIHPSVMIRSDLIRRLRYDSTVRYVEDFDLWLRTVKAGYRLHNLDEYLFLYRVHPESISASNLETQLYRSYESFCRHVTSQKISYEEYLSFYRGQYELNPLRRAIILFKLSKDIQRSYWVFFRDNIGYTKMWLQINLYNLISAMPGFSILRRAKRQLKLFVSGLSGDGQSI